MDDVNKSSRMKIMTMATDEELENQPQVGGDFRAEGGIFDFFRKAEIWVPDEVYAERVAEEGVVWYGTHFQVGIVPPEQAKVTSAEIRVIFTEPVRELGAWYPNDVYSAYREVTQDKHVEIEAKLDPKHPLLALLPAIDSLLPQLSAGYRIATKDLKLPEASVIRTISDGQRRVAFQLSIDPKTDKDPRQFRGQVLFGIAPNTAIQQPLSAMRLEVTCRCGPLRLKSMVTQDVDIVVR